MNIAIITGASAGLGISFFHSICRRHPRLDAIWLIARREERLQELAKDSPIPVVVLPMDLTDPAAYDALAAKLKAENPAVRVLVNNAGVGQLDNIVDSDWPTQARMVDLNCRALTAVTTVVLPHMEPGCGTVINVASIASFAPNARMTVYSSTKAYVMSFSRGLREELKARGNNVLAVCPGPMNTEFLAVADITGRSPMFKMLPYSDPEKVADRAVALAAKGRAVYTPRLFFKFYRVLAKLLPHSLIIKLSKT
ncbi:MAG: SDR family NAD(P)-dependent oxidoreductase [Clostridia bacterium]|nr:SDR family NAD(P)-dependent oxidoreductase [Clostridia bacterium]